MGRSENIVIFENTIRLCKTDDVLSSYVKKAKKQQRFISGQEPINIETKEIAGVPAKIVVSKKRSLEAAMSYQTDKVCVLNFASAGNPGGGVTKGSTAQEECICRCSTLYECLNTKQMRDVFYGPHRRERNPLHNDDIIYTPEVVVFKTDTALPELMDTADWKVINVITCAAPNLRGKSNRYNPGDGSDAVKISDKELLELHEKRLRRILDVAVQGGNDVIILGAFGCGAFRNKPGIVAKAAKNVIAEYMNSFKVIEFAVYCSPRDEENYNVFKRML